MKFLINICVCLTLILSLYASLEYFLYNARQKKIKNINVTTKKSKLLKLSFLRKYTNLLELVLKEYNIDEHFNTILYSSLAFMVVSFLSLIFVKQLLLAIISPFLILKLYITICSKLTIDINDVLEEQLPVAVDNIIRISSKYSDLKSIIFETSKSCDGFMKTVLEDMSRKMLSTPTDVVLMEYAKKYDNIWFYSIAFTLISYLENSSKEDTLENLKNLRNMLVKENTIKKASVTDKRYSVVVNLVIVIFALIGFIANLVFNPTAKVFYFSTLPGLICFLLGFACIIITIFINIKMVKNKKR